MAVGLAASVAFLAVVSFILWLIFNTVVSFIAVKLGLVRPGVPNARGGISPLRFRVGPTFVGVRLKRILLAQRSLELIASFLVGLYPVEVAEVRIFRCKTTFSYGLRKFLVALFTGRAKRGILAPKLIVRAKNVRIVLRSSSEESWKLQKEAVDASIENSNHAVANWLTELIDKRMNQRGTREAEAEAASPPPNALSRLIDAFINGLDVDVEGFHISWASENFGVSAINQGNTAAHSRRSPQQPHSNSGEGSLGPRSKEWNMGLMMKRFSLAPGGPPTPETMGVTPRAIHVDVFDAYLDQNDVPSPGSGSRSSASDSRVPGDASAIVVHDEVDSERNASPVLPEFALDGSHNTIISVDNVNATLLFPDVMSVLLSPDKQPQGNGKLLGLWLDEMDGVVVHLEPFQVYGLLTDVLPVLSLSGKYTEWYTATRLQWHKDTLARPLGISDRGDGEGAGGGVPDGDKELQVYAEALGYPETTEAAFDGSESDDDSRTRGRGKQRKKGKRDSAKLKELDKNMTLVQIMLTRMRVRKWEFERPERVSNGSKALLDQIDPFQGVPANEMGGGVEAGSGIDIDGNAVGADGVDSGQTVVSSTEEAVIAGGTADVGNKSPYASDQEAPSELSRQGSLDCQLTRSPSVQLQTTEPEEAARLEALLYLTAQVSQRAFKWVVSIVGFLAFFLRGISNP